MCSCLSLVFVVCCVGSGLCDKLITRPEESYRVRLSKCLYFRNLSRGGLRPILALAPQKNFLAVTLPQSSNLIDLLILTDNEYSYRCKRKLRVIILGHCAVYSITDRVFKSKFYPVTCLEGPQ